MNEHEAERIAAAIDVLRPDWPRNSLLTLMKRPELAQRPRRDVLVALAWVASETNSATPARVLEAGPWWRAVVTDNERRDRPLPPKRGQDCPHHPGQHATNCGGCRADQLAGPGYDDERATKPPRSWDPGDPATGAAACRAAMRTTTATVEETP